MVRHGGDRGTGAAYARDLLARALQTTAGPRAAVEVGVIRYLGGGLARHAYGAHIDVTPDHGALSGPYVVLIPATAAAGAGMAGEHRLLLDLQHRRLPFRVPRPVVVIDGANETALVQGWLRGVELDLRTGRQQLQPWDIVGLIAAALHAIPAAAVAGALPGHARRREHALASLRVLDGIDDDCARIAAAWGAAHLPPDGPAALLHGDLLGQNILIDPSGPPGVVDWAEACGGDPAYDLAVVTRAARRPFQIAGGLDRLLSAYQGAGGSPSVTVDHVRIHELALLAGWVVDTGARRDAQAAAELDRLRGFVRRL